MSDVLQMKSSTFIGNGNTAKLLVVLPSYNYEENSFETDAQLIINFLRETFCTVTLKKIKELL